MRRIFSSAPVKIALFLGGYMAAVSMARAASHTFDVLFGRFFGFWFRFDMPLSLLLLLLFVLLLLLSVWMTKGRKEQDAVFRSWRKIDFSLLLLSALYAAGFFLYTAHGNWVDIFSFFPPFFAYAAVILTATEFIARLRDGDFLRSLYWPRFFRAYPIWKPLGFLFSLMLLGNLIVLFALTPAASTLLRFRLSLAFMPLFPFFETRWYYDLTNYFFALSALCLVALTYFAAVLLSLGEKYDMASAETIRAERFKSELITNVSHDIRTPLTSIINYVDFLKAQPLEGVAREYVAVLDQKSARLKTLIDDLMEASKAGTGNLRLSIQRINLTEMIGQIAGEFDGPFTRRQLTLVLRQPDEAVFASVDSRHLWRALENLFSNAAKYALSDTRVFAELTSLDGAVLFSLKNTSQSPIDLPGEALTEQFIRGDRAREGDGSGLGLYIAKSLVELMGGEFAIDISGDLFEVRIVLGGGE